MNLRSAWAFALISAAVMAVLSFIPQMSLWQARGDDWAGSYASGNYDEVAYSAYVNGLIHGKDRKYDPYMGEAADHESIFSLQFIPPYVIAIPARVLGLSASEAFIALSIILAIASSLSLFFLYYQITEDSLISSAGALIVLCLGTAITLEGYASQLFGVSLVIEYFPFLRRYQPGFGFPLFFVLCSLTWASLVADGKRRILMAFAAGVVFSILVYSYFYLWTAAAAWLGILFLTAIVLRPEERKNTIFTFLPIIGAGVGALIPYFYLLNQRSRNSDEVQLLALTHAPDLTAPTFVVGFVGLAVALFLGYLGRLDLRSLPSSFAISFLLLPAAVLNQQVLTGRSLQPVHYEIFIANYCVLTGIVLVLALALMGDRDKTWTGSLRTVAFAALAIFAALWGVQEAFYGVKRNESMVMVRDAVFPAAEHIRNVSYGRSDTITINSANPIIASFLPTVVPARILWTPHLVAGGTVGEADSKKQFYRFLYFSGFKAEDLKNALSTRWFEMVAAIFGGGRALPQLGGVNHPITDEEIQHEVQKYHEFIDSMDEASAYDPELDFYVLPVGEEPNFTHLDKWYIRNAGEIVGHFKVYTLSRRNP